MQFLKRPQKENCALPDVGSWPVSRQQKLPVRISTAQPVSWTRSSEVASSEYDRRQLELEEIIPAGPEQFISRFRGENASGHRTEGPAPDLGFKIILFFGTATGAYPSNFFYKTGMDQYKRERSKKILLASKNAASLEEVEIPPKVSKSSSSPNLLNPGISEDSAPLKAKVIRARVSASFSLPKISPITNLHCTRSLEFTTPANHRETEMILSKYGANLRFLVPGRLAFAVLKSSKIISLKEDCRNLNILALSSHLHSQYAPLCADFGPVTINVVHRFCQVFSPMILYFLFSDNIAQAMSKRVSKSEPSSHLVIYCIDCEPASVANASFLLAAFLLLVVGHTAEEAALPFAGPASPCVLAPFRDASYCRQVPSSAAQSKRPKFHLGN